VYPLAISVCITVWNLNFLPMCETEIMPALFLYEQLPSVLQEVPIINRGTSHINSELIWIPPHREGPVAGCINSWERAFVVSFFTPRNG
jgi:hypothetical protein